MAMLIENLSKVKEVLKGKSVDLSACMRSADYEEYIKMYAALWFVDDQPLNNATPFCFTLKKKKLKVLSTISLLGVSTIQRVDLNQSKSEPDLT